MRRLALCCCMAVVAGCSGTKDEPPKEAMEDTAAAPPAPAAISLADVAGKWDVRVMPENADTTLVAFEMTATADTTGWTNNYQKRPPVPVRVVAVDGDSIVTEAGPFESMLRKGVKVSTRTVNRLQDGKLVGTTTARYQGGGPDSVLHLRSEATRKP